MQRVSYLAYLGDKPNRKDEMSLCIGELISDGGSRARVALGDSNETD